jgi:hypothetical protein
MPRKPCACGAQVLDVPGAPLLDAQRDDLGAAAVTWTHPIAGRLLSQSKPQAAWNEHRYRVHECKGADGG